MTREGIVRDVVCLVVGAVYVPVCRQIDVGLISYGTPSPDVGPRYDPQVMCRRVDFELILN